MLKKALDDAAQALKRLFGAPQVHALAAPALQAPTHGTALPKAESRAGLAVLKPVAAQAGLFAEMAPVGRLDPFHAQLCEEEGWAQWEAGARVCVPELFRPGAASRMAVPALMQGRAMRLPIPKPQDPEPHVLEIHTRAPRAFRIPAQAFVLELRQGLGPVLRRPFAFESEDVQKLPKAIWMRYSLALVKATGENVRNLEVLGLWRVPRKGISGIRPEAGGRLWVQLSADAIRADRAAFMVARKKDDQSLLSAFVE